MKGKLSAIGSAIALLACAGCGSKTDTGGNSQRANVAPGNKSGATQPAEVEANGRKADTAPAGQALRFPDPGEGPWKKWLTYSESEEGEDKYKFYRIPGDSFSKYYDVEVDMSNGDQNTDILNDKGKPLDADFYRYADYIGIRKTRSSILVFAYYLPDGEEVIGNYNIARIEGGEVKMHWCTVSRKTLEQVATERLTVAKLSAARFENAPAIVDLLTSAEPDLKRDGCI